MSPWLSFPPAGGESRAVNSYSKQVREDYNYSQSQTRFPDVTIAVHAELWKRDIS